MTTQILLVPGFWLGSWAWDEVARHLRERDFVVRALTLPGLQPQDRAPEEVTLQDQADAIAAALDPGVRRRVLVLHSGSALPGTMVLDQHPDLVDRVVFVDTAPARDGATMDPDFAGELYPLAAAWDAELADGSMRDLTEEQLDTFRERAVPQPGRTVREPVTLSADPRRLSIPATVVCTAYTSAQYQQYAQQGVPFVAALPQYTEVEYVDLPTGHWPMWSRPAELADVIAAAAGPHVRPEDALS